MFAESKRSVPRNGISESTCLMVMNNHIARNKSLTNLLSTLGRCFTIWTFNHGSCAHFRSLPFDTVVPHKHKKTHRKLVGEILATPGIRQGSKKWSDSFGLFVCTWCSPIWRLDTRTSGFTNIKQFVRTMCICNGAQVGLTALSDLDNIFKSFACIGFSINLDMLSCSGCW